MHRTEWPSQEVWFRVFSLSYWHLSLSGKFIIFSPLPLQQQVLRQFSSLYRQYDDSCIDNQYYGYWLCSHLLLKLGTLQRRLESSKSNIEGRKNWSLWIIRPFWFSNYKELVMLHPSFAVFKPVLCPCHARHVKSQ